MARCTTRMSAGAGEPISTLHRTHQKVRSLKRMSCDSVELGCKGGRQVVWFQGGGCGLLKASLRRCLDSRTCKAPSDTPADECPAVSLCQLELSLCMHIALPFKPVGPSVQDGPAVLLCIAGEDGLLPGLCAWTELWLKKVKQLFALYGREPERGVGRVPAGNE